MKKIFVVIFCILQLCVYSQEKDFLTEFIDQIQLDNFQTTITWLNSNNARYQEYMAGCPKNIVTVSYEEKKYNAMDAVVVFDKSLLSRFIPSCAGGHASTPPTIFQCIKNNDLKYVKYLLDKGTPKMISWEIIASLPRNLFSYASTDEMRKLLLDNGCPQNISVNNYNCEISDDHVNVRASPGIAGKVQFQVNRNDIGIVSMITPINETIAGNTNRWCFVKFENGKSGWVFGQFVHIFWLDGM
jgi:hypothetical protein